MFCTYCGNVLPDGAKFCPSCGNAATPPAGGNVPEAGETPEIVAETPPPAPENAGAPEAAPESVAPAAESVPVSAPEAAAAEPSAAPQVSAEDAITNRLIAWLIACVPLMGSQITLFTGIGASSWGSSAILYCVLNSIFCSIDESRLKKQGFDTSSCAWFWGALLVPVYIYRRARLVGDDNSYFIGWFVMLGVSMFVDVYV